jgi:cell division protein ZapA (FtsZ GTPase activity inhibitor)
MKVIVTIKRNNKDANVFCKEIEMTPQEYDNLKEIAIEVNNRAEQVCLSAYVHQI